MSRPSAALLAAALIVAPLVLTPPTAQARSGAENGALNVEIDRSARIQLRGAAASVIVANPQIADVSVVDANTLFIVGKGYGVTEVVAVDGVGLRGGARPGSGHDHTPLMTTADSGASTTGTDRRDAMTTSRSRVPSRTTDRRNGFSSTSLPVTPGCRTIA